MGLDMYLHATKTWPKASDEAAGLATIAGISVDELEALDPEAWDDRTYLSTWNHDKGSDRQVRSLAVLDAAGLLPLRTEESGGGEIGVREDRLYVQITCAYWRKANAVHAWFVDEVQGGTDDCGEYPVHVEKLAELRKHALDAVAKYDAGERETAASVLQPRSGFFFGGTDVDDWWRSDLEATAAEIERVINTAIKIGGVEFSYHSSW